MRSHFVVLPSILLPLILLVLCHCPASAAEYDDDSGRGPERGDGEFTLSAAGQSDNDFDSGAFGFAASLGYYFTDGFEIGARQSMTFFDSTTTSATLLASSRGFLDYNIDFGAVRPFLGVNLGVRYGNGDVDTTGIFAPEAGFKIYALQKTFILLMAEYQIYFDEVSSFDDQADDGQFVYTLGIGFNF